MMWSRPRNVEVLPDVPLTGEGGVDARYGELFTKTPDPTDQLIADPAERLLIFKDAVMHWLRRLDLLDWEVSFGEGATVDGDFIASTQYNPGGRQAVFLLSRGVTSKHYTVKALHESALHEVLELLLAEVEIAMKAEFGNEKDGMMFENYARHGVIHRLMNVLMGAERTGQAVGCGHGDD